MSPVCDTTAFMAVPVPFRTAAGSDENHHVSTSVEKMIVKTVHCAADTVHAAVAGKVSETQVTAPEISTERDAAAMRRSKPDPPGLAA